MPQLTRTEAERGTEERLAATVHACPGLELVPVPSYLLLDDPGGRVARGGRMLSEHLGEIADLWEHAGCRVRRSDRGLIAEDPAGYRIEVRDDLLLVVSPPVAPQLIDRSLLAGLASGLGVGCLGPCVFSVGPLAAFPSLAGLAAPIWAWIPLFLLVSAGCLALPETRRFGTGLLISGALLGTTVAVVFST